MSDATDNRFYREPPVVVEGVDPADDLMGRLKESVRVARETMNPKSEGIDPVTRIAEIVAAMDMQPDRLLAEIRRLQSEVARLDAVVVTVRRDTLNEAVAKLESLAFYQAADLIRGLL